MHNMNMEKTAPPGREDMPDELTSAQDAKLAVLTVAAADAKRRAADGVESGATSA
jgi:hypothetical protein